MLEKLEIEQSIQEEGYNNIDGINKLSIIPIPTIQEEKLNLVTENTIIPNEVNLGVYSLSYCNGCKFLKNELIKADIPFIEYQLNDPETNSFDKFVQDNINLNQEKYNLSNSFPQMVHIYDFPVGTILPDFESAQYEKSSLIIKDFNNCIKDSNLKTCIEDFVSSYTSFYNSFYLTNNNTEQIINETEIINLETPIINQINELNNNDSLNDFSIL